MTRASNVVTRTLAWLLLGSLTALVSCTYRSDRPTPTAPPDEVCDGEDNDGDGQIDEGFGIGEPCRGLGECGEGVFECAGPFARQCSSERGGSESGAAPEICDGLDNNCDGDVDEGFGVGDACELPGGCPATRQCSEDHSRAQCAPDPAAVSEEICDGRDNDCDGYVDYSVGPSGVRSACECVEQTLWFGARPQEESFGDAAGFCNAMRPSCAAQGGELALSFCLTCAAKPYAMCAGQAPADLSAFVTGGGRALRVRFSFESDTESQALVNLYYTVDLDVGGKPTSVRRYFRLLNIGDPPGTYAKTFLAPQTCFAENADVACRGSETACDGCRLGDSCGDPSGGDCKALSFESAQLQVAVEDGCATDPTFAGVLQIHEVSVGPALCAGSTSQ